MLRILNFDMPIETGQTRKSKKGGSFNFRLRIV